MLSLSMPRIWSRRSNANCKLSESLIDPSMNLIEDEVVN
jgi:hypothetical protein